MSTPRFLADEDLRYSIVAAGRRREPSIDFVTVAEIGKAGESDSEVLEFAQSQSPLKPKNGATESFTYHCETGFRLAANL